jgi:hypothetical protein
MYISVTVENNLLKKEWKKRKQNKGKTQQHRWGLMLGLADLMPDFWLVLP